MTLNVSGGRTTVPDDLLDELTSWPPGERVGLFRKWHQGAFSLIQLNVVAVLEAQGPLSMSRLAEALDVSVASATGIVDRMEHRGLVVRRHEEDDRRVVVVSLAEAGTHVFRDMAALRREHMGRLLAELTPDELAGFVKGIRAVRAARQRFMETVAVDRSESDCGPGTSEPDPSARPTTAEESER
jgi:DNA-binding MarR family transcriptional regulator